MLKAQGLEYEAAGQGEVVLLSHGGHVADGFLPLMGEASLADRVAGAIDLFMSAAGAADWRRAIATNVPGAAEQAEKDAATSFEVEIPALAEPLFDGDRSNRISQPILYAIGTKAVPSSNQPSSISCR